MPNGYESLGELSRTFDRYRQDHEHGHEDILDELKFLRRLLFTTLGTAVLFGLVTSTFAAIRGA